VTAAAVVVQADFTAALDLPKVQAVVVQAVTQEMVEQVPEHQVKPPTRGQPAQEQVVLAVVVDPHLMIPTETVTLSQVELAVAALEYLDKEPVVQLVQAAAAGQESAVAVDLVVLQAQMARAFYSLLLHEVVLVVYMAAVVADPAASVLVDRQQLQVVQQAQARCV
jgi:hypothetical protein